MAREIDHVLVDGRWRMIQNCRIDWSAQSLNTDQRLVVATLNLQRKSRRMVPSQPRKDVGKLKDERVAEEFANRLSRDLGGLGALLREKVDQFIVKKMISAKLKLGLGNSKNL